MNYLIHPKISDTGHVNALNMMKIQEDKDFLMPQREKERRGAMSYLDEVLLIIQKRQEETLEKVRKRKLAAEKEAHHCPGQQQYNSSIEEPNPVPDRSPSALQTPPADAWAKRSSNSRTL